MAMVNSVMGVDPDLRIDFDDRVKAVVVEANRLNSPTEV